jgi:hypothetical protein
MSFQPKVHPDFNKCRIVVTTRTFRESYTLVADDVAHLVGPRESGIVVLLDESDDLPYRVQAVFQHGKQIESYSIIPNGKKNKSRFART